MGQSLIEVLALTDAVVTRGARVQKRGGRWRGEDLGLGGVFYRLGRLLTQECFGSGGRKEDPLLEVEPVLDGTGGDPREEALGRWCNYSINRRKSQPTRLEIVATDSCTR